MRLLTLRSLFCQQFLYRLHDPQPNGFSLHVPGSKSLVGPHGGFNVGCFAMLLNKLIGGAVDVGSEVMGHPSSHSRHAAAALMVSCPSSPKRS